MVTSVIYVVIGAIAVLFLGLVAFFISFYKKVPQGMAMVRTGSGGTKVEFDKGMFAIPVLHMIELMDLSVKTVEIGRMKEEGLICKDNIRADIKVVFFVRVNKDPEQIKNVAQSIGCKRASDPATLRQLFEAKFSEALKTVGKRFEFVELYDNRDKFKQAIVEIIGTDLNGYVLDDAAIDYLEQTPSEYLKMDNILDAEGIKKITELTAAQKVKANFIKREEEKTLKEQDVEAREAILEYERQLAEKEERQRREIANIKSKESAEIAKISEEERLKAEMVRIQTEEKLAIAEENKSRQVIIALKNKERAEAVENERVEKDRLLEQTERERIVTLAEIEKQRAIEEEKKNIQDVIKERIVVEKRVVEEEERIKDTREVAAANRAKQVAVIKAEEEGEAAIISETKLAEADRLAAEIQAQKLLIDAEAEKDAASREAEARKIMAEAKVAEEATIGLSEAQVIEAKAKAKEQEGMIEAAVLEKQAIAEAKGIEAKASAAHKQGLLEAEVLASKGESEARIIELKAMADAKGVAEKAKAMQQLDEVGRDHEEYKLRLEQEKEIALANIDVNRSIAEAQAHVLAEAFSKANIDIVGGDQTFVNNIMSAIGNGKRIDQLVGNSHQLQDVKSALIGNGTTGQGAAFSQLRDLIGKAGVTSEDLKNLSLTALLLKLQQHAGEKEQNMLYELMSTMSLLAPSKEQ